MRVAVFSSRRYEQPFLIEANRTSGHELCFFEARLEATTTALATGCAVASLFVNDDASAPILRALHAGGVRMLALRSAGFNHVDVAEAERLGILVTRVPAYSPHAVAEHTIALMLALNRKLHRAHHRVREQNFALDGLVGFDMYGKTVGLIGTGRIGEVACRILVGFGCRVLCSDPTRNAACESLGATYVPFDELLAASDIVSLHCPLTPGTHYLIGEAAIARMRHGAMLINTSRGGLVDTAAVIAGLKRGHLGAVGLDVYEEEGDLFFRNLSDEPLQDDRFARLLGFPNVLVTAHQGFLTAEALRAIAAMTVGSITLAGRGEVPHDRLVTSRLVAS